GPELSDQEDRWMRQLCGSRGGRYNVYACAHQPVHGAEPVCDQPAPLQDVRVWRQDRSSSRSWSGWAGWRAGWTWRFWRRTWWTWRRRWRTWRQHRPALQPDVERADLQPVQRHQLLGAA